MAFKKKIDMGNGSLLKGILAFAFPYMLTGILARLYNAADMVVVGRYASQEALAGVGASGSMTMLIIDMFLGLSMGVSITLGRALGAKDKERAHHAIHTGIALSLIGGLLVSIFGIVFASPLLRMTGVPDNVLPQATIYMQIIFAGKVPMLLYTFSAAMLRAMGDPKKPLYIGTMSGILNVLLNLVFVLGFKMQADGVALATIISQLSSAVAGVYFLLREDENTRLYIKKIRIYKEEFFEILRIGIPSGIQASVFSLANVIIQWGVNSLGDAAMAGTTAAGNIAGFYYIALNTFCQAAMTFVSFNMGAKKYDRVKKTLLVCLGCTAVVWAIEAVITFFGAEFLVSIYAPGKAEAIRIGTLRMMIIGYTYGLCGFMEVFSGALRGMKYSFSSMIISIVGVCSIRITWVLTVFKSTIGNMPIYDSARTLFLAMPLSWIGTLSLFIIFYVYVLKKKKYMVN